MLLLLLLFLVASHTTSAVQFGDAFLSEFERTDAVTGNVTRMSTREIEFTCDQNSFRSTSLQVGDVFYEVKCSPPVHRFNPVLAGFVTQRSKIFFSSVFVVDSSTKLFNTTNIPDVGVNSPTARRLLQFEFALQGIGGLVSLGVNGNADGLYDSACVDTGWGIDPKGCKSRFGGNPGADPGVLRALKNVSENLDAWSQRVTNQSLLVTQAFKDVKNLTTILESQVQLLQTQAGNLNATVIAFGQRATDFEQRTKANFDDIRNTTQVEFKFVIGEVDKLRNATNNNFKRVISAVGEFKDQTFAQFTTVRVSERKLERAIRQLSTDIYRLSTDFDIRRKHSVQVAALKAQCEAEGLVPFLHPAFPGVDPFSSTLTTIEKTILIDTFYFNWVNATVGNPTVKVHHHQVSMYCNQNAISDRRVQGVYWADVLDLLGTPGCSAKPGATVDNCVCWIAVEADRLCPRATGFQWNKVRTTADQNAYILAPSMCQSSASDGPWAGRIFDNVTAWHAYLGLVTNTSFEGGDNIGLGYFQLVSLEMGVLNITSVRSALLVPIQIEQLMTTDEFEMTLPFAVYIWLQLGFARAIKAANAYERFLYGALPNYLTCEKVPNQYLPDGSTYLLDQCAMLCVDPATQPVFSIRIDTVVPLVTSTGYDGPPDCSGASCTFAGRHVVSTEAKSTVTTTVPFAELLPPSAGSVVVGEQTYAQAGFIYDIPRDAPLSPVPASREGSVLYLVQPIPGNYDFATSATGEYPPTQMVDGFLAQSGGVRPNHNAGAFSIDLTQAPLLTGPHGGRCSQSHPQFSWLCEMYDHWRTGEDTDFRQGSWSLVPDEFSYSGVLAINTGQVLQRVTDGCPELDIYKYTDGTVDFSLRNSLPAPITVFARITTTGVGPGEICALNTGGDVQYDLEPRQTFTKTVPRCGRQTLQIFRQSATGAKIQCPPLSINITSNPTAASSIERFTLGGSNSSFIENIVAADVLLLSRQMTALLSQAQQYLDPTFQPQLTYPQRSLLYNQTFEQYLATAKKRGDALNQLPPGSFNQIVKDNLESGVDLAAAFRDLTRQFLNSQASFSSNIGQQDANNKQIVANENGLHDSLVGLEGAIDKAITDLQNGSESSCESGLPWIFAVFSIVSSVICFFKRMANYIITFVVLILFCCAFTYAYKWWSRYRSNKAKQDAVNARIKREADADRREEEKAEREDRAARQAAKAAERVAKEKAAAAAAAAVAASAAAPAAVVPSGAVAMTIATAPAAGHARYLPIGYDSDDEDGDDDFGDF